MSYMCVECDNKNTYKCLSCVGGEKQSKPIVTNYDRVISKTLEELAEWVWDAQTAGVYTIRGKHAWIEWLKSPVDKGV